MIGEAKPARKIPAHILELASNVIKDRETCSEWYSKRSSLNHDQQYQSHQYFIDTLRKVYRILEKLEVRDKPSGAKTALHTGIVDNGSHVFLANKYAQLVVEQPSEVASEYVSEPIAKPARDTAPATTLEKEGRDDKELALWCFLEDVHDLRSFVQQAWSEYRAGEISFFVATSVTDVAFGLMARAHYEFDKKHQGLLQHSDILDFLRLQLSEVQGAPVLKMQNGDSIESTSQTHELLCPTGAAAVEAFITKWEEQKDQDYVSHNSRMALASPMKFEIRMLMLVSEIEYLTRSTEEYEIDLVDLDEFTKVLFAIRKGGRVPAWFTFAWQTYIDIEDIIGVSTGKGISEFRGVLNMMTPTWEAFEGKLNSLQSPLFLNQEAVQNLGAEYSSASSLINFLADQRSPTSQEEANQLRTNYGFPSWMPRETYRSCLATVGKRLWWYKIIVHLGSTYMVNECCFVLAIAHLYKACKHYGLLNVDWKDMDWFLDIHGKPKA